MKIEKDKPLPDHTKLDYDECCAKLILEELFPERYGKLLLADKPDLQGKGVGIEVTIANDRNMQEALHNWIRAVSSSDEEKRKRNIDRMQQLSVEYTGGIQSWPGSTPSFSLTRRAIEEKIKKLKKGNYLPFSRYELFVFTDTWYHEDIVAKAKEYLYGKSVSTCFQTVYVFSQGADLHVFETCEKTHQEIIIDNFEQTDRNVRARQMVEIAEESE